MLFLAVICSLVVIIGAEYPLALIFMTAIFIAVLVVMYIHNAKPQYIVVIFLSLFMIASTINSISTAKKMLKYDGEESKSTFVVNKIEYQSDGFCIAEIKIKKSDLLKKGTKLTLYYNDEEFEIGDIASGKLGLSKLNNEYKINSYSKNIFLTANIKNCEITDANGDFLLKSVNGFRCYIKDTVMKFMSFNEASTLCALLFGEQGYFTSQFDDNVAKAGVSHVMVVSGMHLTILVKFFTFISKKIFYNRYMCAVLQLLTVLILSAVCGFTMSILRAGVMYVITSVGLVIKRKHISENALGAAVSFVLICSPFAIYNSAFQLSVLSTFGILGVAFPIRRYIFSIEFIKRSMLQPLISALLISVCATIFTLPVSISLYKSISLVGVITTLIITYPITISIWMSIVGLLVNLVSPSLAEIIFNLCEYIIKFVNYVINSMASLSFSFVSVNKIWVYVVSGIIILIFCVLVACKKRLDMLKLKRIQTKIIKEGGRVLKWR